VRTPELGVGLSYFGGLAPLLEEHPGLVDVLEVEPQTFWTRLPDGGFRADAEILARLAGYPCPKLLHGIGFPVGGVRPPSPAQVPPLLAAIEALAPPWMSEHLSFNRAGADGGEFNTAFLLPPRQTPAGVEAAATSIRAMADAMPIPLAVETGVSYLRPRPDEMDDGAFVAAVVERADCDVLLDLHNLWANERNGRQPVDELLARIPLERVREIHLAGGFEHRGFWLDSHSGPVPEELFELAERVVPRLPALGALIFELFPTYLSRFGLPAVRREVERLRRIWDRRGRAARRARRAAPADGAATRAGGPGAEAADEHPERTAAAAGGAAPGPTPREWEDALGALVVGRPPATPLGEELAADPGIEVVRYLIGEFRGSMVVTSLKLTSRLIMLSRGTEAFERLLAEYWRVAPPAPFAADEAAGFAEFLARNLPEDVPYVGEILAFERAVLATLLDETARVVPFSVDPLPFLRALGEARLPDPEMIFPGSFEVEVTPDDLDGEAAEAAVAQLLLH